MKHWLDRSRRIVLAAAALALAAVGPAAAADYAVLIQGEAAGQVKVVADGARRQVDFSYRNNGRGPDLRESFELDAQGMPVRFEVSGTSTFGAAVSERFERRDGRVTWQSRVDRGDEAAPATFAFIPLESSPAYTGALASAMAARPGEVFSTVGGAAVRASIVARHALQTPDGALPLMLLALTGIDLQPWYVWLRDDATREFFAITWPGWAVIAKGHEAATQTLVDRQTQAVDDRLVGLRKALAQPLSGLTRVRQVRWFDAPAARMRGPADVWIFDGRIAAVTAPDALKAAADQEIDGRGRSLIPGLWDMHAHLWSGSGPGHLAAGVTGAREPAGFNAEIPRLKARLDAGELPGPTMVPLGFIEGRSPFSARFGIVAEDLPQALAAVDYYAARGYPQIKLYNSIKPAWVRPIAAHAHRLGLRVGGHVPAFMRAEQAVRDGYDELTHINQVMLNFVSRAGDDSRTLLRFERVGADAHRLDLKSARARQFIDLLRRRGTVLDLTLYTFEAMFTQQHGQPDPSLMDIADHLPVLQQRNLKVATMDLEGEKLVNFRRSYARMLQLTGALHRAGLTLVAGTDGWEGLGLHRELALYVKAGIAPAEALRIGTWNGAKVAGQGDRRGRIERGYQADLVLVDGDPSVHITDLRKASLVIQGRHAFAPAALYESMGIKPFVPAVSLGPAAR